MDVKGIHEKLKIALSPKDYVELLTLMIKDVEKMIEWGEKQKGNSEEGNDENIHEQDRQGAPFDDPCVLGLPEQLAGEDKLPDQRGAQKDKDGNYPPIAHQRQHRREAGIRLRKENHKGRQEHRNPNL